MIRSFAILPAAGTSERMNAPKLLLPWESGLVIDAVLTSWLASAVEKIVVAIRAADQPLWDHIGAYRDRLAEETTSARDRLDLLTIKEPTRDMKETVGHAVTYIEQTYRPVSSAVWLLAPADLPRLTHHTMDRLLAEHNGESPTILVPRSGDRRGHPVLFPWPLAGEVNLLAADEGINQLLRRHPVRQIPIEDGGAYHDIDTPTDYQQQRSAIKLV